MDLLEDQIVGAWIHSHEEDSGGGMVFRRSGMPMPPSRGRIGFTLNKGGTGTSRQIASSDGLVTTQGIWRLADRELHFESDGGNMQIWHVDEITPDRLEMHLRL